MSEILKAMLMLIVGAGAVLGFYYESFYIVTGQVHNLDPQVSMLIGNANGTMGGMAMMVVGYLFGSSKASADKDGTIKDSISKIPVVTSTVTATTTETQTPKDTK